MRPEKLFPLFAPLESLKGIGAKTAVLCTKLCGNNIIDLLFHLPTGYIDRRVKNNLSDIADSTVATVKVRAVKHLAPFSKKSPYKVICSCDGDPLTIVFFHAFGDYPAKALPPDEERYVSGRVERFNGQAQITHPDYIVPVTDLDKIPEIEAVYPLTAGVTEKMLNKAATDALGKVPAFDEWIDSELKKREQWPDFATALSVLHRPKNQTDIALTSAARARLAYDELLANQLALGLTRKRMRKVKGRSIKGNSIKQKAILDTLKFSLTSAQKRVLSEISADMTAPERMLRLVQGDVGSGKTIVALLAMTQAVEAGCQAALMAPTDILANQHFASLSTLAEKAGMTVVLLTGRHKGKKRDEILAQIANGSADIVVGTHALFSDDVVFKDLALTVVDEQHKFGVHQRLSFAQKGVCSDMLVMTATPIPRTLALTCYGDMDVSQIDELPPGRKPIITRALPVSRLADVVSALKRTLDDGNKVYWICPLVEENEKLDLAAAEERYADLRKIFGDRVGLVHGKMKAAEKDAVMDLFAHGAVDVLVATTVVEVGVDVPQATVMVIEHSERFGLAQLHQLRGRIGRGQKESVCLLLYATPLSETAKARLSVMRDTQDGFRIAEEDLVLRGAGEVLGTRQSGMPEFKMADLSKDGGLLKTATNDTKYLLNADPDLTGKRGAPLRDLLYLFSKDDAVRTLKAG